MLGKLVIGFMNGSEAQLDGDVIKSWRWTSEEEDGVMVPRLIVITDNDKREERGLPQRIEYPVVNIRRVGVFTDG